MCKHFKAILSLAGLIQIRVHRWCSLLAVNLKWHEFVEVFFNYQRLFVNSAVSFCNNSRQCKRERERETMQPLVIPSALITASYKVIGNSIDTIEDFQFE